MATHPQLSLLCDLRPSQWRKSEATRRGRPVEDVSRLLQPFSGCDDLLSGALRGSGGCVEGAHSAGHLQQCRTVAAPRRAAPLESRCQCSLLCSLHVGSQLKSSSGSVRLDGARNIDAVLQQHVAAAGAASAAAAAVPAELCGTLVNALMHELHAHVRDNNKATVAAVVESASATPANTASSDSDAVACSLSALSLLLAPVSRIDPRACLMIARKLIQFRDQLAPQITAAVPSSILPPLAASIDRILAAHPDLMAAAQSANAADAAAAAATARPTNGSSESATATSDRAALRQAKERRKQEEAAEKRRIKAAAAAAVTATASDSAAAPTPSGSSSAAVDIPTSFPSVTDAAATAVAPFSAASSDAVSAIPSAAAPSSAAAWDVHDGTESAPFGNFHNYYFHNAAKERMQFIPTTIAADIVATKRQQHSAAIVGSSSSSSSAAAAAAAAAASSLDRFCFLDVGCNEGDLTIALMQHVLAGLRGEKSEFAPVDATMPTPSPSPATSAAASSSSSSSSPPLAPSPSSSSSSFSHVRVHALGVDIDPELIARAQGKIRATLEQLEQQQQQQQQQQPPPQPQQLLQPASLPPPSICFAHLDVMQPDAIAHIRRMLEDSLAAQATDVASASDVAAAAAAAAPAADGAATDATTAATIASLTLSPAATVSSSASAAVVAAPLDLVCCYSITLWIHLHHGDCGLRHFLSSLCALSSNVILEPQPWSCYRTARERWRRKGKPDPPKMKELQWRSDVETRIIEFVTGPHVGMRLKAELGSTKWNRRVLWFDRA